MIVNLTEANTNTKVAINPNMVQSVFVLPDGEHAGKTLITIQGGGILVSETLEQTVSVLNGAL